LTALTFCAVATTRGSVLTLALDTSTASGSVAVRRDGNLVVVRAADPGRPHATRLPGDLLDALHDAGASLDDVTVLAVGLGPGAFTGLRVGLATMQGLAFARGLPVVGVSALDAIASAAAGEAQEIAIWLDGARKEVFAARYRRNPSALFGVEALSDPISAPPETVLIEWERRQWPRPSVWVGEGVALYREVLLRRVPDAAIRSIDIVRAELVADLGERAFAAGLAGPPHALRPVYVRRPDAELARDRAAAAPGHV
jgi:tRNA threonylcarbamoyladenosine biosynthesis protein TsaB